MDKEIELLHQFVDLCKRNPGLLHEPKYAFYKEYLESLGATIPPLPKKEEKPKEPEVHEDETMDEPEPPVELDMSGVIEGEKDEPLPMGDSGKEVSDEDLEKANEERNQAMEAFNEGCFCEFQFTLDWWSRFAYHKRNVLTDSTQFFSEH
ncbi:unnamed protein product [Anisakis simplex]|uniref:Hsc70-interacting protein (inferred by orthology to a human protein) n=1 Tax=Anisakis simplex TaxID=6269 RepID=A0A0M3JGJ8_ANISI|nr:unnamed protein product [Anisakis simplex]